MRGRVVGKRKAPPAQECTRITSITTITAALYKINVTKAVPSHGSSGL
jgi:hypothetical protein